jgi:aryl-alcohol dehydrogenase-like predicted oxidoreductase
MDATRRDVLRLGIAAAGMTAGAMTRSFAEDATSAPHQPSIRKGEMLYRPLGNTGEQVSVLGLGGHHIGRPTDEQEAIRLIRSAIDHGMTFMDNCWDYHEGASEIRMGKALRDGYRAKAFVMTKIDGRTKQEAAKQIEESLKRLQTDHIDLMQHHEVIRMWRAGSPSPGQEGREDPVHRLHRAQGSGRASSNARGGRETSISIRRGADAAQCHGCALPQL